MSQERTRWTEEDDRLMAELREAGKNQYVIAKRLGRTWAAVNVRAPKIPARQRPSPAEGN